MNMFKVRMAMLSFLSCFFVRLWFFLIAGIVLMVIGSQNRICLAVGVAFVVFDLLVSVIETVKMFMIIKMSKHPVIRRVNEAINSDDPMGEMDKLTMEGFDQDEDVAGGKLAAILLRQRAKMAKTAADHVEIFEQMCDEKIPGEVLIMECGPVEGKDEYAFCLTRKYPVMGGNASYSVFMALIYKLNDENREIIEEIRSDEGDEAFFDRVVRSEGFAYADSNRIMDTRFGAE